MKLNHPALQKALGLVGSALVRLWRETIDWRALDFDPACDPLHAPKGARYVYAAWHEGMLLPIALRGRRDMLALASDSKDGALMARTMQHLGWALARGSSSKGGISGLLRMLRDDERHLILTPDGPRGPRRKMAQGPVFLASKLGVPLVCVGCGFERPWRLNSWDRFAIPRPYTRARLLFGPPLRVPAKLDRVAMERYCLWFEQLLNWLTEEAERWATDGRRRASERVMLPGRALVRRERASPQLPDWLLDGWACLPREGGNARRHAA